VRKVAAIPTRRDRQGVDQERPAFAAAMREHRADAHQPVSSLIGSGIGQTILSPLAIVRLGANSRPPVERGLRR
jgi:hypothetical protein